MHVKARSVWCGLGEGWSWRAGRRWLAGLAVAGLVTGCGSGGGGPPADPPVAVQAVAPEILPVEDLLVAVGTLEANERVTLTAEAPGLIEGVHFKEGERVRQGQKLFVMDARKEEAVVAQAEAEAVLARSNHQRALQLAGTRAISQQEIDQLASLVAVKEATVQVEKERLADRVVVAPFDGQMGPRLVSPGQYVSPGTALSTLVDDRQVKARFRIPERQFGLVRAGQSGRLRVSAHGDRVFPGQVDLVDPVVDESTRTAEIRLRAENAEGLLRPGMFVRGEIVAQRRERAVVIPESALVASMDRYSVFLVRDGVARVQPVTLGVRMLGRVEIRDGVTAESRVVVSGTQKLIEGSKVVVSEPVTAGSKTGGAGASGAVLAAP